MFYAIKDDRRILADPGGRATCPLCGASVRAKCGTIVCWHWAHEAGSECDPWAESVGPWHVRWQHAAPPDRQEVIIGRHRADIVTEEGWVVEIQDSGISESVIVEREMYYGDMSWIFNVADAYAENRLDIRHREGRAHVTFRWKQARKTLLACRKRVYLDLGTGTVMSVEKFHSDRYFAGWGYLYAEETVRGWIAGPNYPEGVPVGSPLNPRLRPEGSPWVNT